MENGQRWLTLCTPDNRKMELCLLHAISLDDKKLVGKQGGSFPFFSLETDDAYSFHKKLLAKSVTVTELQEYPWGIGFTIHDLYGNQIYINQPK